MVHGSKALAETGELFWSLKPVWLTECYLKTKQKKKNNNQEKQGLSSKKIVLPATLPCLVKRRLLAGQAWLKTSSAALGGGNHSSELSPRQELDVGQAPPWSLSQSQHKPPLAAKNTGVQPGFVSTCSASSSLLGIPHPGRHDSSRKNTQTRRESRGIGRQAVPRPDP